MSPPCSVPAPVLYPVRAGRTGHRPPAHGLSSSLGRNPPLTPPEETAGAQLWHFIWSLSI